MDLLPVNHPVPVTQDASYAKGRGPHAHRNAEGNIVITGIGYYGDEVTLTEEILEGLGFVPYHTIAP